MLGVAQGSILGPLFSIYASYFQFFAILSCKFYLYTDGTQIYDLFELNNFDTAVAAINRDLGNLARIVQDHCLFLNETKSCVIIFRGHFNKVRVENRNSFFLNGTPLSFKKP